MRDAADTGTGPCTAGDVRAAPFAAVVAALAAALSPWAAAPLGAQVDTRTSVSTPRGLSDALVLPPGRLIVDFTPGFYAFDRTFGTRVEGGVPVDVEEPLGVDVNSEAAGADLFPVLGPLESLLRNVGGDPDFDLNLGATRLVTNGSARVLPLGLRLGLPWGLQLGVTVPFVSRRVEMAFDLDPRDANVGLGDPEEITPFLQGFGTAVGQARTAVEDICQSQGEGSAACRDGRETVDDADALFQLLDGTVGAVPILPFPGSAPGDSLQGRITEVQNDLADLGAAGFATPLPLPSQPVDAAGFQDLVTSPSGGIRAEPLDGFDSGMELGDVEVDVKFRFHDGFRRASRFRRAPAPPDTAGAAPDTVTSPPDTAATPPDSGRAAPDTAAAPDTTTAARDTARARPAGAGADDPGGPTPFLGYRGAVGVGVRLGTGSPDRTDRLLDIGSGDGQIDIELRSYNDVRIGRRVVANLTLRYGLQRATTLPRRVAPPGRTFVPASRLRRVEWTPGSYLEVEVSPRVLLTPTVSAGLRYTYLSRGEDEYALAAGEEPVLDPTGAEVPASVLAGSGDAAYQRLGVGIRYSSLAAARAGRTGKPFEVDVVYQSTLDGSGEGVLKTSRIVVGLRAFFDAWGGS